MDFQTIPEDGDATQDINGQETIPQGTTFSIAGIKVSNLGLPVTSQLRPQNSEVVRKGGENIMGRRRPLKQMTTLTSSDVAHKYNLLLDKRLALVNTQVEELKLKKEEKKMKFRVLKITYCKKTLLKQNLQVHNSEM